MQKITEIYDYSGPGERTYILPWGSAFKTDEQLSRKAQEGRNKYSSKINLTNLALNCWPVGYIYAAYLGAEYYQNTLDTKDISLLDISKPVWNFFFHADSQMFLSHVSTYLPVLNCITISTTYIKSET